MSSFKNRSYQKELLDGDSIPFKDIKQNMVELNTINTLLGGHAITIAGVRKIICEINKIKQVQKIVICEIGCGGGDNIYAIHKWANKNKLNIHFIGIDIKQNCIDFAKEKYPYLPIDWKMANYQDVVFEHKPDIIFSSLFCHHFTNEQLLFQLKWLKQNCNTGFFINDLQRNRIAFFLIKFLTEIFSKSYLVKNDAPLSVARSFTKADWKILISKANIGKSIIQWKWAFRYLIVCIK